MDWYFWESENKIISILSMKIMFLFFGLCFFLICLIYCFDFKLLILLFFVLFFKYSFKLVFVFKIKLCFEEVVNIS